MGCAAHPRGAASAGFCHWKHEKLYLYRTLTLKILEEILNGKTPKPGSYRGRINNEPENSRKTLMDLKNA